MLKMLLRLISFNLKIIFLTYSSLVLLFHYYYIVVLFFYITSWFDQGNSAHGCFHHSDAIVHFTVVCLLTEPLNRSEARVEFVVIQTLLCFLCKSLCYHANQFLVSIISRLPLTSLLYRGLVTFHKTVKCSIGPSLNHVYLHENPVTLLLSFCFSEQLKLTVTVDRVE